MAHCRAWNSAPLQSQQSREARGNTPTVASRRLSGAPRALISANFIQHMQRPFAHGKRAFPLAQHKNIARFAQADVHIPYRAAVQHIRHKAMKAQDFPGPPMRSICPNIKWKHTTQYEARLSARTFASNRRRNPSWFKKPVRASVFSALRNAAPAIPQPVNGDPQRDQRRHKHCAHDRQRGKGACTRR